MDMDTFTFRPGQWVDLFVPNMFKVGGFSIASTPTQLSSQGIIDIAVKCLPTTKNEIVHYLHKEASIGCSVFMRIGGEFKFQGDDVHGSRLLRRSLFLAGGVGITPLFSMVQHVDDLVSKHPVSNTLKPAAIFMHSCQQEEELIFKPQLDQLQSASANLIQPHYFVTRNPESQWTRRITEDTILDALNALQSNTPLDETDSIYDGIDVYLCGPPTFEQAMLQYLDKARAQGYRIRLQHEKWW